MGRGRWNGAGRFCSYRRHDRLVAVVSNGHISAAARPAGRVGDGGVNGGAAAPTANDAAAVTLTGTADSHSRGERPLLCPPPPHAAAARCPAVARGDAADQEGAWGGGQTAVAAPPPATATHVSAICGRPAYSWCGRFSVPAGAT